MVASVEIAYVVRDTAADHPGLTAPARIIGMRSQGEAEIAIEQGETRYEGVTWTTRRQRASNQLVPLPEPARRGLINLADDVLATTSQAVAAAAQLDPSDVTRSTRFGRQGVSGVRPRRVRSPTRMIPPQEDHADELDVSSHHGRIDGSRPVPFNADLPVYSLCSVQGSVASCALVKALAHGSPLADASALVAGMDQAAYRMSCRPARCGPSESSRVSAPSCRELRMPKSGGRVMFGRCQTCLDHRSEPISGANDER